MMTKNADKKREQMMMFSMDDMVPQNHMLRLIDKAINWNFIYDLVEEKYCPDNGRPSMDPVMLIKIPFIQYLYGIKSMRQTMKEIEVNVAYRWFLGLDMLDPVPHFSTFGKNYTRRFKDTDLFEQIFSKILEDCMKYKLVNTEQIFVDATHVKDDEAFEKEVKRCLDLEETCIKAGKTVCCYTTRALITADTGDKEDELRLSVKISDAVQSLVGRLSVTPSFVIAKGGITSSDVGTKALAVKKANVLGQIKPGIPVWQTGEESKFPLTPYVIFPGNVGEVTTLREAVEVLTAK